MNSDTPDSSDSSPPEAMNLNCLIGDWDVSESHTCLAREKGVTLVCPRASGFGKASCEWAFNDVAVLYKLSSEGHIVSAIVGPNGGNDEAPTESVLEGTAFLIARGFTAKMRIQWPIEPGKERIVIERQEEPFQSQMGVFLQRIGETITASFQLPNTELLMLTGRRCCHSLTFETDKSWPCSTLLAEIFSVTGNEDSPSLRRVGIVLRPMDKTSWVLVVYHILNRREISVIRSVFLHRLRIPELVPNSANEQLVVGTNANKPDPDRRCSTLDVERELACAQVELADAEALLEKLNDDYDWGEHELATVELDFLGIATADPLPPDREQALANREEDICLKYRQYLDLGDQVTEQETKVALLEAEVWELEDVLENRIQVWQDSRVREAERVVAEAIDIVELPYIDLAEFQYVADHGVSGDVVKLLQTMLLYRKVGMAQHGDAHNWLDFSPWIGTMAKVCERLFSDAFSVRRNCLAISEVSQVLKKPNQFEFDIPAEDKEHNIDKGSLCKVLGMIDKSDSDNWSGTRSAAVAMLLFGEHHRLTNNRNYSSIEIRNPLGVGGTFAERKHLRVALYQLQTSRNGFTHHDIASLDDAKQFEALFVKCARGLVELLYSKKRNAE